MSSNDIKTSNLNRYFAEFMSQDVRNGIGKKKKKKKSIQNWIYSTLKSTDGKYCVLCDRMNFRWGDKKWCETSLYRRLCARGEWQYMTLTAWCDQTYRKIDKSSCVKEEKVLSYEVRHWFSWDSLAVLDEVSLVSKSEVNHRVPVQILAGSAGKYTEEDFLWASSYPTESRARWHVWQSLM